MYRLIRWWGDIPMKKKKQSVKMSVEKMMRRDFKSETLKVMKLKMILIWIRLRFKPLTN